MSEYKVGCSPLTGKIFAGTVRENKDGVEMWTSNKHEVTEDAVNAVVQRLKMLPGMMEGCCWEFEDGKDYVIKLVEWDREKGEVKE